MKKIVIIDYGSGNLHSVYHAFLRVKKDEDQLLISSDPEDLKAATHIVLPGVGAFGDCAENLKKIEGMAWALKRRSLAM